jgi:hypothetical protein
MHQAGKGNKNNNTRDYENFSLLKDWTKSSEDFQCFRTDIIIYGNKSGAYH